LSRLRILLTEDHEVVRRGIRSLIEAHREWEVCAEAEDGVQAVQRTIELQRDVLIIDMSMPRLNGLQACAPQKPRTTSGDTLFQLVFMMQTAQDVLHCDPTIARQSMSRVQLRKV
jgi:DNA-binding NarL/FixJ family response regulator